MEQKHGDTQKDQELLRRFERKIRSQINRAAVEDGLWCTRYNFEVTATMTQMQ